MLSIGKYSHAQLLLECWAIHSAQVFIFKCALQNLYSAFITQNLSKLAFKMFIVSTVMHICNPQQEIKVQGQPRSHCNSTELELYSENLPKFFFQRNFILNNQNIVEEKS